MTIWLVSLLAFGMLGLATPPAACAQDSAVKVNGRAPAVLPVGETDSVEDPEDLAGNDIVRDIADDSGQFFSKSSESFRVPTQELPMIGGVAVRARGVPEIPGGGSEMLIRPSH